MKTIGTLALTLCCLTAPLRAHDGDIVKVGDVAPPFTAVDSEGNQVSLGSFKGKVVLVDFFATWCGACMEEMPKIQSDIWAPDQSEGLVVLGVGREHTVAEMAKFKAQKMIGFTLLADPKRAAYSQYAKEYIPRTYLIDRNGIIRFAAMGYEPADFDAMKKAINAELAKK